MTAYLWLSKLLRSRRDLQAAIALLEEGIGNAGGSAELYVLYLELGVLELQAADIQGARRSWEAGLATAADPDVRREFQDRLAGLDDDPGHGSESEAS